MSLFDQKDGENTVGMMYLRNWKAIAATVLACTLIAFVVSKMLTPRYRAKASFFIPFNTSLELANENPQFGYDVEADRLLQLLRSEQLKDSVIRKFNLVSYYQIDTSSFAWQEKLSHIYDERIFANRTNVMSIVIEAEMHDPVYAARIVDYIVQLSQRMRERVLKTNSELAVEAFRKDYLSKKTELDSIRNRILDLRRELGESNITIVNAQTIINNRISSSKPEKQLEMEALTQMYISEQEILVELKSKYETAENIHRRPIPKFYVLDQATPIYKKAYPLTIFNISMGFFGSLVVMLAGLYLKHVIQTLRKLAREEASGQ